ncbi:MAG: sigma-70 family RNA polymerase sigma factor [Thermoanaerobaculia bacterium]
MPVEMAGDVTEMLLAWNRGEPGALDRLLPAVQRELHKVARGYMRRERPDHTLQATALVNETYLKLVDQTRVTWKNRAHFIGVAAQLMRRILVDHARERAAKKRGRADLRLTLTPGVAAPEERSVDLVALDLALEKLAALEPRQARVVEMRFFGGLTSEETAEALDVSPATIKRDWIAAKAYLFRELKGASA